MAVTLNSGLLQCVACIVSGAESISVDIENLEMKVTHFFRMLVTGIAFRRLESFISLLWKPHNWYRYDHYVTITIVNQLESFLSHPPTYPHYLFLSCSIHTFSVGHMVI
jgi:hypothetical protein